MDVPQPQKTIGRPLSGQVPKLVKSISVDAVIYVEWKNVSRCSNFSGWIQEQMRRELLQLKNTTIKVCNAPIHGGFGNCKQGLAPYIWNTVHEKICPTCKHDHNERDLRIEVKKGFEE